MKEKKEYADAQNIFQHMIGKKITEIQNINDEQLRITMDNGKTFEIKSHPSYLPTIQEI